MPVVVTDGSTSFAGGVDSIKSTTVASPSNPNGLGRDQLAWLANATVRDGGITPRTGWEPKGIIHDGTGLFQDAEIYSTPFTNPYLMVLIGGRIYKVDVDFGSPVQDISGSLGNPPAIPYAFMQQAEQFMIIQAGDFGLVTNPTPPLFWDGATLRRSVGIISPNNTPAGGLLPYNELPAAGPMDYYQGRVWYGQGRTVSAGDIVGDSSSGSLAYKFKDAVLKVTENPLAVGGDGFSVPDQSGDIRAIKHSNSLDTTLGQGNLFLGTTKQIYSLSVPITRANWIAATANNQPQMTVIQINNGMVNDRSVVAVNADLFYQCLEPSIRSLQSSIRYYGQWSNTQISANEERILAFNDRSLMRFASGINFDNRLLQAVLPRQTPQGVVHDAILPLDFTPISSFDRQLPPVWEGHYEGLQVLKLVSGDFGGLERAFAIVVSAIDQTIQLWEITNFARFDSQNRADGGDRISSYAEFPAFNNDRPFDLKDLVSAELWIDKLFGTVDYLIEYRPDGDPCWHFWTKFRVCSARNSCESVRNPICYPLQPGRESYRATITLPKPPNECGVMGRPVHRAYQFQVRITQKGWARTRGLFLKTIPVDKALYENMSCGIDFLDAKSSFPTNTPPVPAPQPKPPAPKDVLGDPTLEDIFGNQNTGDEFGG